MKTYPYLPELYLDPITKIVKAFYRPMIKVRISQNRGEISESFDALVDSGSDKNLFPIYFANKIHQVQQIYVELMENIIEIVINTFLHSELLFLVVI